MANTPKHAPVIDLRQLAFSQRSGDQSPHRSRPTMTMMTSKTKEKGKSRAMTLDDASNKPAASPGRNFPPSLPPLSPTSLPPRSPTHAPSPPLQMETLSSPLNFPRCEDIQDIFVPAATSTQQPPPPLPKKGGHPPPPDTDLSQSSPFDTEALDLSAAVRVERDVDFAMWIREVPVVEEGEEGRGEERDDNAGTVVPRASQSAASTGPAEIAFGK
ncbi:hypothetical protein B0F90DRAFT_1274756 [Multifurca ochricompacta]|uniref:Uncharacterized protein n=1 Tax=Multifurca ochricompacta TaxID=376703 RepID=A0AAD4LYL9_9AGAM|nr:hypothetical protein B0F90DRAFT_1274756 [Multifurca ochricompacta]